MTYPRPHADRIANTRPSATLRNQGVALDNQEGQRLIDAESQLLRLFRNGPGGLGGPILEQRDLVAQRIREVPGVPPLAPARDMANRWVNNISAAREMQLAEQQGHARTAALRAAAAQAAGTGRRH